MSPNKRFPFKLFMPGIFVTERHSDGFRHGQELAGQWTAVSWATCSGRGKEGRGNPCPKPQQGESLDRQGLLRSQTAGRALPWMAVTGLCPQHAHHWLGYPGVCGLNIDNSAVAHPEDPTSAMAPVPHLSLRMLGFECVPQFSVLEAESHLHWRWSLGD